MLKGIKPVFLNKFPVNYKNDIHGWGFTKETIKREKGKLLTIDIDYGSCCRLNCPHCFKKNGHKYHAKMDRAGFEKIILQAIPLGLKSVKFLGAGEPFENNDILEIFEFLNSNNIIPLVFTSGYVFSDEDSAKKINGVSSCEDLLKKVLKFNVSIMLKYNAFDSTIQNNLVGNPKSINYSEHRDEALKKLIQTGFNSFDKNRDYSTKLALAINPVTNKNIHEALDLYKWARRRNIYAIVTPTMISGRAKWDLWEYITPPKEQLTNLYKQIYSFNIEAGLQSIEQIYNEGISSYAGGHPCNQVSCGLYITLNGDVYNCPGRDDESFKNRYNALTNDIEVVWKESKNLKERAGRYNCHCIAKDGKSISNDLYYEVENFLFSKYSYNEDGRLFTRNSFKQYLNEGLLEFIKSWYETNGEIVGISIQLEDEIQSEYSPTRICTENEFVQNKKLINSYCLKIQANEANIPLCNDLDYYLKKRLDETTRLEGQNKITGIACRCHKGVSNIIFRKEFKLDSRTDPFIFYIFIGHILIANNDDNIKYLKDNKIENIINGINGREFLALKPDVLIKEADYNNSFTDHNITFIKEEFKLKSLISNIKEFLDKKIEHVQKTDSLSTDLYRLKYKLSIEEIIFNNSLLKRQIEELIKNESDLKEKKERLDLLKNIDFVVSNYPKNKEEIDQVIYWQREGLKGKATNDSWYLKGDKLKIFI
nr:4Fe-4S cluster-binding domain-containing protein [uncultured Draconibacterium sp.]